MDMVKSTRPKIKKPEYVEYLKDIAKSLNRIAEELAIINERTREENY